MPPSATDGLLLVLSEPGRVPVAEFHDWYDHEHVPGRTAFAEVRNATRWRAADDARPTWLATYDVDLEVLRRPEYTRLREHRSPREQAVVERLEVFERRVYEQVAGPGAGRPGPMTVAVSLDVAPEAEGELAAWYAEEHEPMLAGVEGWLRTRRYRLRDGDAPRWLALHDVAGPHVFEDPRYREAVSTPRRARVMAQVLRRERRVFAVHRRFD